MALRGPTSGVTLHRFFLPAESFQLGRVTFPAQQSQQIRKVLRLRRGDRVIALDGSGTEYVVHLDVLHTNVLGTIEDRAQNTAEPAVSVSLYQGLLKAAKFEPVLQKCTEIGVSGFVPILTDRCIRTDLSPARQRRFDTIVREAAEQSRRGRLPPVGPPMPYVEALRRAVTEGSAVLLWEEERETHLRDIPAPTPDATVGLFVGPEGGFTAEEVAEARKLGAAVVTLGKQVLRAETASIVGSALLLFQFGALG